MQSKSQIRSIGIDLRKTTFRFVALGTRAQVVMRKKSHVPSYWSTRPICHPR